MQVRPLSERVTESMFQIAAEFEMALQEEIANHKQTMNLLQRVRKGEVDIQDVIVTDDGWQIMPPEPAEEDSHGFSYRNGSEPAHVG